MTNANQSVSTVNDRLFPVELTEIADWKSMSEYMVHLNFGKTLTRVICGNFGSYNLKLLLPYFLNICLPFWMFYKWKEYLNKIKNSLEFRQTNSGRFRKPSQVVLFEFSQQSSAKCRGLMCELSQTEKKRKNNFKQYRLLKIGLNEKGLFYK